MSTVKLREGFPARVASVRTKTHVLAIKTQGFKRRTISQGRQCSVEARSVGSGDATDTLERSALKCVRFWESNVLRRKLLDLSTFDFGVVDDARSNDLNGVLGGAMSAGHLHVHLADSSAEGHVSVLLVHVNSIGTGEVTKDDAIVPDCARLLLEDLACGDDFTLNLADLMLSLHMIPELGASENSVSLEHSHSVELRVGVLLSSKSSSHNKELSHL